MYSYDINMAVQTRRSRASARGTLSRQAIIATGIALADREGLESVTIRRLALLHNVTPMALYRHFKDKNEIVDGIAEGLIADIRLPPPTKQPWHTQLRTVMEAVVAALRPHPTLAELVPTRFLDSPSGLAIADRTLELLGRAGLPQDKAAEISGYLLSGLVGMVTVELGRHFGSDPEERDDAIRARMASLFALPPRKYPNVVDAASSLAVCASPDAYYKLGIDILMTGLIGVTKELTRKKR
jgi:TetR/AcrR family transcriptional regulator, tetracycline repressor protein